MTDLAQLELDLINAIGGAQSAAAVEDLRVAALGKSGSISALLKGMGALSPDERREQGPVINGLAKSGITVDRKVLSDLAIHEPAAFQAIAEKAKAALAA